MNRVHRIYITGASCAGVTTLGTCLAQRLAVPHLDVDDYFWLPTDPPYTTKRPPEERIRLITEERGSAGWVLSGSLNGWGDTLADESGLVVFVDTPTALRMQRLDERERKRFGERLEPGGDMHDIHVAFREWASRYDDPTFSGRNRARHEAWLADRPAPVLRVDGTKPVADLEAAVISAVTGRQMDGPRPPTTA
jgi:adenylate kinase family enzyme